MRPLWTTGWRVGIDEVGRGPLAGPIVVAGVMVRTAHLRRGFWQGIRDSKKLSPKRREDWFSVLTREPKLTWAVASVWPRVIDRVNIARAANRAVYRVYRRLTNGAAHPALLDGGLALPNHIPHRVITKGDERVPLIAAASIIAKVRRDRTMRRLHRKFPQYRFDLHKGYGTRLHRDLIRWHGHSEVHRISFLEKIFKNG